MKKLNIKIGLVFVVLVTISFCINALLVKSFSDYELSLVEFEKASVSRIEAEIKNIIMNIPEFTGVNRTEEYNAYALIVNKLEFVEASLLLIYKDEQASNLIALLRVYNAEVNSWMNAAMERERNGLPEKSDLEHLRHDIGEIRKFFLVKEGQHVNGEKLNSKIEDLVENIKLEDLASRYNGLVEVIVSE